MEDKIKEALETPVQEQPLRVNIEFTNANELTALCNETIALANNLNNNLKKIKKFKPEIKIAK